MHGKCCFLFSPALESRKERSSTGAKRAIVAFFLNNAPHRRIIPSSKEIHKHNGTRLQHPTPSVVCRALIHYYEMNNIRRDEAKAEEEVGKKNR